MALELLLHAPPAVGARIGVFSYGSGAACTMFRLRVRGTPRVDAGVLRRLDARGAIHPDVLRTLRAPLRLGLPVPAVPAPGTNC